MRWPNLNSYGVALFAMQRLNDEGEQRRLHAVSGRPRFRPAVADQLEALGFAFDADADQYVRDVDGFRMNALLEAFPNAFVEDVDRDDVIVTVDLREQSLREHADATLDGRDEEGSDERVDDDGQPEAADAGGARAGDDEPGGNRGLPATEPGGPDDDARGPRTAFGELSGAGEQRRARAADEERGQDVERDDAAAQTRADVALPAEGHGDDGPDAPGGGGQRDARGADTGADRAGTPDDAAPGPAADALDTPPRNAENYRLGDLLDHEFAEAFDQAKRTEANLAALEVLAREDDATAVHLTPDDKAALARYVGWGGLPKIVDAATRLAGMRADPDGPPVSLQRRFSAVMEPAKRLYRMYLDGDLPPNALRSFEESTLNAHFTDPRMVRAMWSAVERLGFNEGRVLEPGCGTGNFFGLVPDHLRPHVEFHGVEKEPVSARIASRLYPNASVENIGFERFRAPAGSYALAIGNVPFGAYSVSDPDYNAYRLNIHNHFLLKSLDLVQEGGIVALMTSTFTLDAGATDVRRLLAERGELLTAVRLPQRAFARNANTEVNIDILIFRRVDRPEMRRMPNESLPTWVQPAVDMNPMREDDDPEEHRPAYVSRYFLDHPDHMLGELTRGTNPYGGIDYQVKASSEEIERLPERLEALWDEVLPAQPVYAPVYGPFHGPSQSSSADDVSLSFYSETVTDYREGSFALDNDGNPVIVESVDSDGAITATPVREGRKTSEGEVPRSRRDDLVAMIGVRDAVVAVLKAQEHGAGDEAALAEAQAVLNERYDAFVERNGPLTRPRNARLFSLDPQSNLLFAIERYNSDTDEAVKNDIFYRRVVDTPEMPDSAENAEEALGTVLAFYGRVVPERITALLGRDTEDWPELVAGELNGHVYRDPVNGEWLTAGQYLSGHLYRKIEQAERAARVDPSYEGNIEALKAALPEEIPIEDIPVQLSAPWLEEATIRAFIAEIANVSVDHQGLEVAYEPTTNTWKVSLPKSEAIISERRRELSTDARDFLKLVQAKLNRNKIRVTYTVAGEEGNKKAVLDEEATLAAIAKAERVEREFRNWLWSDPARAEYYHARYNREYNSFVRMKADGRHLVFPGMNPSIELRPHQKDAAWFAISHGNVLFAHEVGTGKTIAMIASLMELNRLGRARRPFLVVKRSTLNQIAATARNLYPAANIITVDGAQITKETRERFLGRLAVESFDLAVMSHETFQKIGLHPATEQGYIEDQVDQLRVAYSELAAEEEGGGFHVKEIAGKLKRAQARLQKLVERRQKRGVDDMVTIEQIAPGAVAYDESQALKNLEATSRTPALQNPGSDRANIALMMFRALEKHNPGFARILASGTPVSNSFAEVFGLFRFLAPGTLHQLTGSVNEFSIDGFAGQFIATESKVELGVDGTYKERDRIRVQAIPELISAMHFMDVRFADDLGIPRPEMERKVITAKPNTAQQILRFEIADRADAIKMRAVEPRKDNFLKLASDGRKGATDPRLIDPRLPDEPGGKLHLAADEIAKRYHFFAPSLGTQAVFLDQGVPKDAPGQQKTINLYADLRDKLVERGVAAEDIAFIHDAKTDAQRERLFDAINAGSVRVIIGSTEKMGVGTNMQERMVGGHHVDPPAAMRPSDMEQRTGRFYRQGNSNESVENLIYTTEGSFDLYIFQLMEAKRRMIHAVLRGDRTIRSIDEDDGMESYDDIMAATTNNPAIARKIEAEGKLARLKSLVDDHERSVQRAKWKRMNLVERVEKLQAAKTTADRLVETTRTALEAFSDDARDEGRFWQASITHCRGKPVLAEPVEDTTAVAGTRVPHGERDTVWLTQKELLAAINNARHLTLETALSVPRYQMPTIQPSFRVRFLDLPARVDLCVKASMQTVHSGTLDIGHVPPSLAVELAENKAVVEDYPSGIESRFLDAERAVETVTGKLEAANAELGRLEEIINEGFDGYDELAQAQHEVHLASEAAQKAVDEFNAEREGLPWATLKDYVDYLEATSGAQRASDECDSLRSVLDEDADKTVAASHSPGW